MKLLRAISGQGWLDRINRATKKQTLKAHLACIVWADFFGTPANGRERPDEGLKEAMEGYVHSLDRSYTQPEMEAVMIEIGLSPKASYKRSKQAFARP